MRKKRRAESIFGAVLLLAGLATLSVVVLTLVIPPRIPDEFKERQGNVNDEQIISDASLVNPVQATDDISSSGQSLIQPEDRSSESSGVAQARNLPAPKNQQTETAAENLPAHQQNAQFVDAMGQTSVGDEETFMAQPVRVSIPTLGVDAPIEAVGLGLPQGEEEEQLLQWAVPNGCAVGWHHTSAPLHAPGNTVLNGHNNMYGAVFRNLIDLELGERLVLYDDDGSYEYEVTQRELFEEDGQTQTERHWNARWMLPTSDERLTIISCWPFSTNTHRVVVVAHPVDAAGT